MHQLRDVNKVLSDLGLPLALDIDTGREMLEVWYLEQTERPEIESIAEFCLELYMQETR